MRDYARLYARLYARYARLYEIRCPQNKMKERKGGGEKEEQKRIGERRGERRKKMASRIGFAIIMFAATCVSFALTAETSAKNSSTYGRNQNACFEDTG